MGPEVPLRIAGPADVGPVAGMIAAFRDFLDGTSPGNAEIEATVAELLEDRNTEYLLIGEPAFGFAQIRFRLSVWTGSEDAWLEDLFVSEGARGKGFGSSLVRACLGRARSRGCHRIQLDVNRDNAPAVALYEGAGFSACHLPDRWGDAPDLLLTLRL